MSERRVLQVLGRSAGGIARHVAQIVEFLDGHDGLAIDIAAPPDLPLAMPKPVHPIVIPDGPRGHGPAVRELRTLVDRERYDVVHAHGLRAGIDSALAARRRARVLVTVHNLVRPEVAGRVAASFYRVAEPLVVALSHHTWAVSGEIAAHLRRRAPRLRDKIEVLHLGVGDPPEVGRPRGVVRADLGWEGSKVVVTVARLAPQKALPVMLGALTRLGDEVLLAVVGQGPQEDELKDVALRLGVQDRVQWLGWRSDVADLVAAGDVFCLSSDWEGVPLAAQEAVLLQTPVVATDVGGLGELITDGESGRLVPRRDPVALAAALQEVLGAQELAARFTERALQDLLTEFSTERMLERLRAGYLEDRREA